MKIKITAKSTGEVPAEIIESLNPKTAKAVIDALPIRGLGSRWGDEIYFSIGVSVQSENAKDVVEVGDVAYWPPGQALCIFFGPTPASRGQEPRAASPVNVFGKVLNDASVFRKVRSGEDVVITKAE
ncbi:cyclophilin-like fold protein [Candidatus Bathyarchaeota archaeon]|nr:cyclophilin-like fold protein [Candidatus Bathyarchaeota archaeon]